MDENKLGSLYTKIAQTVIQMIPEDWKKVYLYGEITEDVGKTFFYYYPEGEEKPVYFYDVPELFNIDKEQFKLLWHQLLDELQELWEEFKNAGQDPWTNLTLIFDKQGEFKINYNYQDLSDADDNERSIVWEYEYLGFVPEDEDDKRFLEEYLNSIKENDE
jgi:uncharacterized protein (TIGR01741 family)